MSVIRLSPATFLSTKDGTVITEEQAKKIISKSVLRNKNVSVNDRIAQINGRDSTVISFDLKGMNANVSPGAGFLVTVYLSSSGSLQRLYKKRIIDPADQSVFRGSYEDFIEIEFDYEQS